MEKPRRSALVTLPLEVSGALMSPGRCSGSDESSSSSAGGGEHGLRAQGPACPPTAIIGQTAVRAPERDFFSLLEVVLF